MAREGEEGGGQGGGTPLSGGRGGFVGWTCPFWTDLRDQPCSRPLPSSEPTRVQMLALVHAVAGLSTPSAVTFATKVKFACAQLGIDDAELTLPAALRACYDAIGIAHSGPLMLQADELVAQLGLSFDAPATSPPPAPPPIRDLSQPRLVVFDLDFTLWQPELYQLSSGPPFKASSDGCVLTARGERLDLFPAARSALAELGDAGVPVAIASRASERDWALQIMRLLRVDSKRTVADVVGDSPVVIQGGSKTKHLRHIAHETGVPLREMIFFDNERSNIQEVEKLGVTCVYCPRGLKDGVYRDGLALHLGTTSSGMRQRRSEEDEDEDGDGRAQARAARGAKSREKRLSKDRRGGRGR